MAPEQEQHARLRSTLYEKKKKKELCLHPGHKWVLSSTQVLGFKMALNTQSSCLVKVYVSARVRCLLLALILSRAQQRLGPAWGHLAENAAPSSPAFAPSIRAQQSGVHVQMPCHLQLCMSLSSQGASHSGFSRCSNPAPLLCSTPRPLLCLT